MTTDSAELAISFQVAKITVCNACPELLPDRRKRPSETNKTSDPGLAAVGAVSKRLRIRVHPDRPRCLARCT
jgi:hypothetical protein